MENRLELWHGFNPEQKWQGQVVCLDRQADLALVWVAAGNLPWVKIDPEGFTVGEPIVSYSYGRSSVLRKAEGKVVGIKGTTEGNVPSWDTGILVEPGDSGSGIFNADGELIGVTYAMDIPSPGSGPVPPRNNAISATHLVSTGQAWEVQCGGNGCRTFRGLGGGMGGVEPPGTMVPVRPPVVSEERPSIPASPSIPRTPDAPTPAAPSGPSLVEQLDKVAEKLAEKLASDPKFRGPPGEPGPQGPPGKDGQDGAIDYAKLLELLASDPRFKPQPGVSVSAMSEADVTLLVDQIKDRIQGQLHYEFVPHK